MVELARPARRRRDGGDGPRDALEMVMRSIEACGTRFDSRLCSLVVTALLSVVWAGCVGGAAAGPSTGAADGASAATIRQGVTTERLRDIVAFERAVAQPPPVTASR